MSTTLVRNAVISYADMLLTSGCKEEPLYNKHLLKYTLMLHKAKLYKNSNIYPMNGQERKRTCILAFHFIRPC